MLKTDIEEAQSIMRRDSSRRHVGDVDRFLQDALDEIRLLLAESNGLRRHVARLGTVNDDLPGLARPIQGSGR